MVYWHMAGNSANTWERLMAEQCPHGVEYKALGELCEYVRGVTYNKSNETTLDNGLKILRANNIDISNNRLNFKDVKVISKDVKIKDAQKLRKDDILMSMASGSKTHVGKVAYVNNNIDYYFGGFMAVIRCHNIINSRFVFHLLSSDGFSQYLGKSIASTTINNISSLIIKKYKIPVPPFAVQEYIVSVLDKFTELKVELTAQLKAELTARKKQYEYYRNKLLTFHDVEWRALGDVCLKTTNIKWKENAGKEYHYIDLSSVNRENNKIIETETINSSNSPSRAQQIVFEDDVIFGTTRPTLKRFCFIPEKYDGQICSTGFCILRADTNKVLPKYLYFSITTSTFNAYVKHNQEGASYPSISNIKVKQFQIPIPPLAEQARIVSILDKFDTLVNSISEGLPREIELRQKQYEYYRDYLLSFGATRNTI